MSTILTDCAEPISLSGEEDLKSKLCYGLDRQGEVADCDYLDQ
jgi:hypothetical protein